jgi:hypothetical protein
MSWVFSGFRGLLALGTLSFVEIYFALIFFGLPTIISL